MAAVPRDPVFWKRFSLAVHMDEEKGSSATSIASQSGLVRRCVLLLPSMAATIESPHPAALTIPHSDSWLEAERKKKSRNCWRLCVFSGSVCVFIGLLLVTLIWLSNHGWFMHGETVTFP